jgi:polyphosphate kinase
MKDLEGLFALAMSDESSSWHLESSGKWTRHKTNKDVQNEFMRDIASRKGVR